MAIMSASSQDSDYRLFFPSVRRKMYNCLSQFEYISARDEWTQRMYQVVSNNQLLVDVTPDPVFSFNQNQEELIPSKTDLLEKISSFGTLEISVSRITFLTAFAFSIAAIYSFSIFFFIKSSIVAFDKSICSTLLS